MSSQLTVSDRYHLDRRWIVRIVSLRWYLSLHLPNEVSQRLNLPLKSRWTRHAGRLLFRGRKTHAVLLPMSNYQHAYWIGHAFRWTISAYTYHHRGEHNSDRCRSMKSTDAVDHLDRSWPEVEQLETRSKWRRTNEKRPASDVRTFHIFAAIDLIVINKEIGSFG